MQFSGFSCIFVTLCNDHDYLIPESFHKKKPHTHLAVTPNIWQFFLNMAYLASYKP